MAYVFATLIINGRKTIDDVPANLKADVEAILKARGYSNEATAD
ncbi:MAG: CD1375 family protein [Peptococcaceae bacterium]|nr:CD1375 family protein [Peptococcaceae bacterium]